MTTDRVNYVDGVKLRALVEKWRRIAKADRRDFGDFTANRVEYFADELQAALDAQAGMVMVPRVVLELAAEAGQPTEVADFAASLLAGPAGPVEGGKNE